MGKKLREMKRGMKGLEREVKVREGKWKRNGGRGRWKIEEKK